MAKETSRDLPAEGRVRTAWIITGGHCRPDVFRRYPARADLVIAARATPQVQKCLAESGVNHFFVYGDKPESGDRPWIRFAPETVISQFANHCVKVGVKHVVQVRFESGDTIDAQSALEGRGIGCSWMNISRSKAGWGRFDGIVQQGGVLSAEVRGEESGRHRRLEQPRGGLPAPGRAG